MKVVPLRGVILATLTVCLAVAMAPWFSGGQEPLAMLLGAGAMLLGLLLAWRQPEVRVLRRSPMTVTYLLLMLLAVASLLWTANHFSTQVWILRWVATGLAFVLAYTIAGDERGRRWLVAAYLISAGIFVVVAVYIYLTGAYNRLTGTFYWPNPAAAYLIPAILLAVDRMRSAAGRKWLWWAGASASFLAAFVLADSRAATVVLGFVLILYLLLQVTNKWYWTKLVFSLAIGLIVSFGLVWLSTYTGHHGGTVVPESRFAEAVKGQSVSGLDRVYYLGSALHIWSDHIWGGSGAGTFGDVHPRYQSRVVSASSDAHNFYVQTVSELGIGALVLLVLLGLWLAAGLVRGVVVRRDNLVVVLGVLGLLLHFGLDIDGQYPALLVLAAALAGVVFNQARPQWGKLNWAVPAVAALMLIPLSGWYKSEAWAAAALSYQDGGEYQEAADRYNTAHSGFMYNPDLISAEGIQYYVMAAGDKDKLANSDIALRLAREAEAADPADGQHHQLEGRVLVVTGHRSAAEAAFRDALRLDPYNHPDYALDLASEQLQAGDEDGAARTAEAMLAQYPDAVIANRSVDDSLRPNLAKLEALLSTAYQKMGMDAKAEQATARAKKLFNDALKQQTLEH